MAASCKQGEPPADNQQPAPSVSSMAPTDNASAGPALTNPHYQRIGGAAVVAQLVDRFYFWMDTLPEAQTIRKMHPLNLTPIKQVLVNFLTEWLGGPPIYSVERGHPRLRRKHLPFTIGAAERDAWMACMRKALADVVADTELSPQLEQAFMRTADFIRNDANSSHQGHQSAVIAKPVGLQKS